MSVRNLLDEIKAARLRAEDLRQAADHPRMEKHTLWLEALEQLQTTLEELQVVDEELRQQNEELLNARSELEAEQQRYKDLFESAPDGYIITDGFGTILEANGAASLLLRLENRFLLRKPLITYVDEADHPAFMNVLDQLSRPDSPNAYRLDLRMRPRLGEPFYAGIRIAVRRESKAGRPKLCWSLRDMTERIADQESIRAINEQLEAKVRRRTGQLEEVNALKDELLVRERQARAEAEGAKRTKDECLAIVSHELRTPRNSILGWAQLLGSEQTDEAQKARAVEVIQRSALAQARIINDILDVSRIVTGNLVLEMNPVNLKTVIEAAVEGARPSVQTKGISLDAELESIGLVIGDSSRLQQVVGNILSNSIKFTPAKGRIDIKLRRAGDHAEIIVSDSGGGIDPHFLPHVFDRFRQSEGQSTRRLGGLGLGLAIVSNLVKMHNGTVQAASDGEGHGATFTVRIPLAAEAATKESISSNAEPTEVPRGEATLDGLWIVVVDDDSDARDMMRVTLEASGARVTVCSSCEETLALFFGRATASLKSPRPDILIADIAMPEQDGFDLIRGLRKLPPERGGNIPAIALTAHASEESRSHVLAEGYQMHLAKPMDLDEVIDAVLKLCAQSGDEKGPPVSKSLASSSHHKS